DLTAMGRYIVLYVPREAIDVETMPGFGTSVRGTFEVIKEMANRYKKIMEKTDQQGGGGIGDFSGGKRINMRYSTQALFTGAVYIYYEGDLTEEERVALRQYYKERGATPFFRDNA